MHNILLKLKKSITHITFTFSISILMIFLGNWWCGPDTNTNLVPKNQSTSINKNTTENTVTRTQPAQQPLTIPNSISFENPVPNKVDNSSTSQNNKSDDSNEDESKEQLEAMNTDPKEDEKESQSNNTSPQGYQCTEKDIAILLLKEHNKQKRFLIDKAKKFSHTLTKGFPKKRSYYDTQDKKSVLESEQQELAVKIRELNANMLATVKKGASKDVLQPLAVECYSYIKKFNSNSDEIKRFEAILGKKEKKQSNMTGLDDIYKIIENINHMDDIE